MSVISDLVRSKHVQFLNLNKFFLPIYDRFTIHIEIKELIQIANRLTSFCVYLALNEITVSLTYLLAQIQICLNSFAVPQTETCQTSKMKLCGKIANDFHPLTTFAKSTFLFFLRLLILHLFLLTCSYVFQIGVMTGVWCNIYLKILKAKPHLLCSVMNTTFHQTG